MSWTSTTLKTYIKQSLGSAYRTVELHDDAFDAALTKALGHLNKKIPNLKRGGFSLIEGQNAYDFSSGGLNLPYGRGILSVTVEPLLATNNLFSEAEFFRVRQPSYITAGDIVADRLYYKELAIVTGTDFDWHWDQDSELLLVSPAPTRICGASYMYRDAFSSIDNVPESRQEWVADFTFALCKQMVGMVRNKFGGEIPGNELSVRTDGADLIRAGKEEEEKLKEELEKIPHYTPPIKG